MTRLAAADGTMYEVRTAGHGPAVLLIHGFTGRGTDWAPFLRSIHKSGFTTVVVDLLGHGRSDSPRDPARHAVERQAADIGELLQRIGAGATIVVGYSMGARVAIRLAVSAPDLVRGLILESPSAGIADRRERTARVDADTRLAEQLERDGVDAFMSTWEAAPIFASERRLPPEVQARIRAARRRNRPDGLAASLRGAGQGVMEPMVDRLKLVACPTLVIAGGLDTAGMERSRVVAGRIPRVRMLILPDLGHAAHRESPARFRRLLIDQLASWRST
jgi:2-succinyl-6-hydroxy-2,4-cyclohexadiene-1-carboxylate synthase